MAPTEVVFTDKTSKPLPQFSGSSGVGFGLTLQQPNIAAQMVLAKDETLLTTWLIDGLDGKVNNLPSESIINGGATKLLSQITASKLSLVLEVYNQSLVSIWYVGLALACLIFVASLGFEWKSVKEEEAEAVTESP